MKFGKALILSACIIAPLFLVPNLLAVTGDPYQRKYVEGEVLVKFRKHVGSRSEVENILKDIFGNEVTLKKHFRPLFERSGRQYILLKGVIL